MISNLLHISSILFMSLAGDTLQDSPECSFFQSETWFFQKFSFSFSCNWMERYWNKYIWKLENLNIFKKSILKFMRPPQNRVYSCHNPKGVNLMKRLIVGLRHLREHKFNYIFQDTLDLICNCGEDIKTLSHYLFHCPRYLQKTMTFLNTVSCTVPIFRF